MDIKKLIAGTALAATLVAGVGTAAYAADSTTSSTAPQTATAPKAATARRVTLARRVRRATVKIVLDQTHTTLADLTTALKGGQTLAQYAAAHGSSAQAVHDALIAKATTVIAAAVKNGKLTQAKANTIEQALPARVDKLLNRIWNIKS
jgi:hypothetical protein